MLDHGHFHFAWRRSIVLSSPPAVRENAAGAVFFGLLVLLMPFRLGLVEPSGYYRKFE
jgi:hypothetical protein